MSLRHLVTGGAGFIGSNIVERLLEDGESVRVLDDLSTGRRSNLDFVARTPGFDSRFELLEGDIRDADICRRAVAGVDTIFHEAALPSVQRSVEDPLASHAVNASGTLQLLVAARAAGVRRVVYASSSSVYGDTPTLPKRESDPTRPQSPYAVAKLTAEQYVRSFHHVYGFEGVALRYFNVFGPRQNPESQYAAVIPRFIRNVMRGEPVDIYGDGEQSRDFTFVENVVQANLLAARSKAAPGKAYNIACGGRISLNELLQVLGRVLDVAPRPNHLAPRAGDIKHSQADIAMAEAELGFRCTVSVEDGLRRTVEHFQSLSRAS